MDDSKVSQCIPSRSFSNLVLSKYVQSSKGNWKIRRQTNSQAVKSRNSQLAKMFDIKFEVNHCRKCDLQ